MFSINAFRVGTQRFQAQAGANQAAVGTGDASVDEQPAAKQPAAPQPAARTPVPTQAAQPQVAPPPAQAATPPVATAPPPAIAAPAKAAAEPAPAAAEPAPAAAEPAPGAAPEKPKRTAESKPTIAIVVENAPDEAHRAATTEARVTFKNAHGDANLWACADAIEKYGGQVRWVTAGPIKDQLDGVQGVLLPGGNDINPEVYKQQPEAGSELQLGPLAHDKFEIQFALAAMAKHLAVRGIGRGMQIINVAANGTLQQNLPHAASQQGIVEHQSGRHRLVVLRNTSLNAITGLEVLDVPSVHHQAIDAVAPGFQVIARTADNVAEAIEKVGEQTIMGVQFHPEMNDDKSVVKRKFFEALVGDSHRVWDRTDPLPGSKPKPTVTPSTTSSKPAEAYKPAPLPLTDERKKELLHIGLDELKKQGYEIETNKFNGFLDHKLLDEGIDDKVHFFLKKMKHNFGEAICDFDRGRLDDLLYSFAGDDAAGAISGDVRDAISVAGKIGAHEGTTFYKKSMLSREPLKLKIQVAWALQDKKLQVVYRNGDGKEKKATVEDGMAFHRVLTDSEYKSAPKNDSSGFCGGCFGK